MLTFKLKEELYRLKEDSLYRELLPIRPAGPTRGYLKDREIKLFCTNNYLGLTHHPQVIEASIRATESFGTGSAASRLISGNSNAYEELEDILARHKGTERALVFSSGFTANLGVITALAGRNDIVFCDRLAHASLIDACILSRAKVRRFHHNSLEHLDGMIIAEDDRRRVILTEGVFSMDGDVAPLKGLAEISASRGCMLLVDDAHGTGVLGPEGRGTAAYLGVSEGIDAQIGTLSKAVGSVGGFVAGSKDLIDYLINKARSFIYTTALPPGAIAAATAAIRIMQTEPALLASLWSNVRYMFSLLQSGGLNLMAGETPIIPVFVGDSKKALDISWRLLEEGNVYIPAIRPPTVPEGQARLRLTVSAAHSRAEIEETASLLTRLFEEEGLVD